MTSPFNSERAQLDQLKALPKAPDVITITLGGNDVGFSRVLRDCFVVDCWRDGTISTAQHKTQNLNSLPSWLGVAYREIRTADPAARVIVVGYPRIFPTGTAVNCGWLTNTERSKLNDTTTMLENTERNAATKAGSTYVSTLSALNGHELCTSDSWVYPVGTAGNQLRGHPLSLGQHAMELAISPDIHK